jgi:hypothetical protein
MILTAAVFTVTDADKSKILKLMWRGWKRAMQMRKRWWGLLVFADVEGVVGAAAAASGSRGC